MADVMHGSRLALPVSLELRAIPSRTMAYASPLIALVLTMVFGLLLFALLGKDPVAGLRVFLVDPHNEYGRCFGDRAQVLNPRNLRLPFWLFNFEETVDAFFGGRPGVDEEVEILSEVIPLAKSAYLQYRVGAERNRPPSPAGSRDRDGDRVPQACV